MSTTKPYCRAKACGSPLVEGQRYCEFHLEWAKDIAAKARATMKRRHLEQIAKGFKVWGGPC
jgi:hypothetical protein